MATNPRKNPNDAALSAVEEALRLDFGAKEEDAPADGAPRPSRDRSVSRPPASSDPVRRGELARRPEAPRTPAPPRRTAEPPPGRRSESTRPDPEPTPRSYDDEAPRMSRATSRGR